MCGSLRSLAFRCSSRSPQWSEPCADRSMAAMGFYRRGHLAPHERQINSCRAEGTRLSEPQIRRIRRERRVCFSKGPFRNAEGGREADGSRAGGAGGFELGHILPGGGATGEGIESGDSWGGAEPDAVGSAGFSGWPGNRLFTQRRSIRAGITGSQWRSRWRLWRRMRRA